MLRLCQRLLEQGEQHREALQVGPVAQLHQGALQMGPEAEQHQEALQLLAINLERRWEAIVMQALQWQTRLKKVLGPEQVSRHRGSQHKKKNRTEKRTCVFSTYCRSRCHRMDMVHRQKPSLQKVGVYCDFVPMNHENELLKCQKMACLKRGLTVI